MNRLPSVCKGLVSSNFRKMAFLLALLAAPLWLSSPLDAQVNTGRISGGLPTRAAAPISGATVTVIDVARGDNRTLTADSAGQYAAPNLIPGIYTVRARIHGIPDDRAPEYGGGASAATFASTLRCSPARRRQTVTVTESLPVINTTNAQTGGMLENQLLDHLPITAATTAGSSIWFRV